MAKEVICVHKGNWNIGGFLVDGPAFEEECKVVT